MAKSDPLSLLKGVAQGKLVPDASRPEYQMYIPSPEERKVMIEWARDEIAKAEKADESRCELILKNRKAYHARENDKDRVITLPIIKRDVNQQRANLVNSIMGKDPICTVKAKEAGTVQVLIQNANGQPETIEVTTGEEATALQEYGENLLRDRIPFRKRIDAAGLDMCRGGMPYFQVGYEANYRVIKNRKIERQLDPMTNELVSASLVVVRDKLPIDEPLRFEVVDGMNMLMPPGENDEQLSPWIAKRWEISPTEVRRRFSDGRFNLASPGKPDPAVIDNIISGTSKKDWQERREDAAELVGNDVTERTSNIPLYELWFYWPVEQRDELTGESEIDVLSLCGEFWCEGDDDAAMLSLYENFYLHSRRPFIPCHQDPDPYEWFSGSTADNLRPIQNLQTALYHITVKNGVQAITKSYKAVMNSPGSRSLKEQNRGGGLKPGAVIDVASMGDIEPFQTGGTFGSLSNEMQMIDSLGRQISVTPEYQNIPNRTPTGTTNAVMGEAKAQGQQTLERMREALSDAILMLMQTAQQFEPYGRTLTSVDPKTKAIQSKFVGMPVNLINTEYSFEITATADEDTKAALRDAETVNLNLVRESNKSIGEMIFSMLSAETPEFLETPTKQLALREESQLERVLKLSHKDYKQYSFDVKELDEWLATKHEFLEGKAREEAAAAAAAQPPAPPAPPPGPMPMGMPPEMQGQMPMGMPPGQMQGGMPPEMGMPPPGPDAELPPDFAEMMAMTGGG
jgi:hypothetical protein